MNPIYQIGTTAAGMLDMSRLGLPLPKATPVAYADQVSLGSGGVRGAGWLQCEWRFTYLTTAQLAALRAFCTGSSATVYVQTLTNGNVYTKYSATVIWPNEQQPKSGMTVDFVLRFQGLTAV
jgi:hypothetical protein